MSLQNLFVFHLMLILSVFTGTSDGYYHSRISKCIYSSSDLSDVEFIDSYSFNKHVYVEFNSTLGQFVGYTAYGVYNSQLLNNDTAYLKQQSAAVESFCKHNAELYYASIFYKVVQPHVRLRSVKQADGKRPAMLVCSAYEFYPKEIKVTWLRDGKPVTSDVTSTEEMANGNWYYQIHSHLEYIPKSGEKISCMVDHASYNKPIIKEWDPSLPESERAQIVIGASGLVLGIVIAAAGGIYYKKKSADQ